jgi:hypothetical protein
MNGSKPVRTWFGVILIAAAARLVDIALVGAGFATAAASVVFAGAMLMRGDHAPAINGLQYLAIFARPRGAVKPTEDVAPARPVDFAGATIDPAPVGSIGAAAPTAAAGYSLVAAQPDFAWIRDGERIFAVRPGDVAPRLGRVVAITRRDGRWILVGEGGVTLLSSGDPAPNADPRATFGRRMIFGPGK